MTRSLTETIEIRQAMLRCVGRVPKPASKLFERTMEDYGDEIGERRLWRTLRWLLSHNAVVRRGQKFVSDDPELDDRQGYVRGPNAEIDIEAATMEEQAVNARPRGDDHWTRRHPDRIVRGADLPSAKLTEEKVLIIRAEMEAGETRRAVAKKFKVHPDTITRIVSGRGWRHVVLPGNATCDNMSAA